MYTQKPGGVEPILQLLQGLPVEIPGPAGMDADVVAAGLDPVDFARRNDPNVLVDLHAYACQPFPDARTGGARLR